MECPLSAAFCMPWRNMPVKVIGMPFRARAFRNVTVVNSGNLSSGMGIAALWAAYMAGQNMAAEDIVTSISTSFIMNSTQML